MGYGDTGSGRTYGVTTLPSSHRSRDTVLTLPSVPRTLRGSFPSPGLCSLPLGNVTRGKFHPGKGRERSWESLILGEPDSGKSCSWDHLTLGSPGPRITSSQENLVLAAPDPGKFQLAESHYSILKGAALLGIGTDNVHLVRTDERGKMIPEELEKEIQRVKAEGSEPLFVCATSGTTVLGAFDPLDAIADICARHGLWLHVDAAWGGSALLSPQLRHLLAGIHRADSVTWNPHKLLMVGLQCSAFLLRDSSGLLQRCHGVGASYLFQRDKFYDVSLDTGDKSPQCGRRADGLKLWILWKAVGTRGLGRRVERAFAATRYLLEQVKRREGFQLVMEPEFINLCFWFIPPSLRGQDSSPEFWDKLGKVAPAIKEKMIRRGSMMVGYQPHGSRVNFFRQIITNPVVTRQDLDFFLDEIQELGWDL
ncbi:cysteine sulfinic acid decarboxylase isoform X3 [Chamaea fasciata]|uniref:cysteine sulfinic acid decarboxylase isoform X3 n=1 Tax=Chamaea fasciata TaxID=190680 RepID=UPI003369FD1F